MLNLDFSRNLNNLSSKAILTGDERGSEATSKNVKKLQNFITENLSSMTKNNLLMIYEYTKLRIEKLDKQATQHEWGRINIDEYKNLNNFSQFLEGIFYKEETLNFHIKEAFPTEKKFTVKKLNTLSNYIKDNKSQFTLEKIKELENKINQTITANPKIKPLKNLANVVSNTINDILSIPSTRERSVPHASLKGEVLPEEVPPPPPEEDIPPPPPLEVELPPPPEGYPTKPLQNTRPPPPPPKPKTPPT